MKREPRPKTARFNERFELALSTEQRDGLEAYGAEHDMSTNAVIRLAISRLLEGEVK